MAHLIDYTYFINDINLPGTVLQGDGEIISQYIAKYEPEILLELLGYDLYQALQDQIDSGTYTVPFKDFIEGSTYDVDGYTVRWNGLINDEKVSFIAYYIYYHYMRNTATTTMAVGETINAVENASRIAAIDKMSNAWNEFVKLYGSTSDGSYHPSAFRYLYENEDDFDNWIFTTKAVTNSFGI